MILTATGPGISTEQHEAGASDRDEAGDEVDHTEPWRKSSFDLREGLDVTEHTVPDSLYGPVPGA
jgi:hypothetical protein